MTDSVMKSANASTASVMSCDTATSIEADARNDGITMTGGTGGDDAPVGPDVESMLEVVLARRGMLEATARSLVLQRAFLERVWGAQPGGDAVPLFVGDDEALFCHPAGADRLSMVLAETEVVSYELNALSGLECALQTYAQGGVDMMAYLGMTPSAAEMGPIRAAMAVEPIAEIVPHVPLWEYGTALARYADMVERELAEAVGSNDDPRISDLDAELTELKARIAATSRAVVLPMIDAPHQRSA